MVPAGDLRDQPGVAVQPPDPALGDQSAEPPQTGPGGTAAGALTLDESLIYDNEGDQVKNGTNMKSLRLEAGPTATFDAHVGSSVGGGVARRHPAGAGRAGFLLPVRPLPTCRQAEEEPERGQGLRGVPAQHQGGGVHGQVRGEELQLQTLHGEERQHPQPQPGRQQQQGQGQTGQPGGQAPQQPQRRH